MPSFLKVSKAAGAASPSFLKPGVALMLTVSYFFVRMCETKTRWVTKPGCDNT